MTNWAELLPQYYGENATDPDEGCGDVELDDYVSRILNKFTGAGGTFSTWNERHAFIVGVQIGYLHMHQTEIIPVPKFWLKESHYFLTGVMMGRGARKIEESKLFTNSDYIKIIGAMIATYAAGSVDAIPVIIKGIFTILTGGIS